VIADGKFGFWIFTLDGSPERRCQLKRNECRLRAVVGRRPFCYLLSAICHHRVAVLLFAICYRHEVAGRNFL
jgi:hypothetical protein